MKSRKTAKNTKLGKTNSTGWSVKDALEDLLEDMDVNKAKAADILAVVAPPAKGTKRGDIFAIQIAGLLKDLLEKMGVNKAEAAEVLGWFASSFEIRSQCIHCLKVMDAELAIRLAATEDKPLTQLGA